MVLRVLVEQLERVNASQMENNAQIAFWINVYNALLMHVRIILGVGLILPFVLHVIFSYDLHRHI